MPPSTATGLPALRRLRIALAVLCFATALFAFVDFSLRNNAAAAAAKHLIASVQFVPSALTLATGFTLSSIACLAILAITFLFGRIYCSVLCPLGILQDLIARLSAKIRRTAPYKLPHKKPFNTLRYGVLAITILAILTGFGGIALTWLDPYSNFGRIASGPIRLLANFTNNIAATIATALDKPDLIPQQASPWAGVSVLLPPLIILAIIGIMSALRGRLWCNTICPVGTALGLVSRRSLWRINIDKAACVKCGDCLRACKAQCIDLRAAEIDFSRCVACYDCISVCDEHGIKYRWHGLAAKRAAQPTPQNKIPASIARPPANNRRAFIATAATGTLAALGATTLLTTRHLAQKKSLAQKTPAPARTYADANHENDYTHLDHPRVVMPPAASTREHMLAQCTACQLCVSACPAHVLEPAFLEYGSFTGLMKPRLNFDRGFCNINCTTCTDVCPDGALTPLALPAKQITRIGLAHAGHQRCIVVKDGTDCGACAEHCPTAALQIKKIPAYDNPVPVVDPRYCIGCGGCQYACPAHPKAIVISGLDTHETAEVLVQEQVKPTTTDDFAF